jgi:hypothetical protein
MYCPKCATPIEGGKFCRACGANVSLIPQALTGSLEAQVARGSGSLGQMPGIEKATARFFAGIGLIMAALAALSFAPAGRLWWFWILIPAFGSIGNAVGQYLIYRAQQRQHVPLASVVDTGQLPHLVSGKVGEASSPFLPGSVIEETTRHLEPVERGEKTER